MGRFVSVGPVTSFSTEPASWNRYAYARNNPLVLIDADGRDVDIPPGLRGAYFWGVVRSPTLLLQYVRLRNNHNVMWHVRSARERGPALDRGLIRDSATTSYKAGDRRIRGNELYPSGRP